MPQAVSLLAVDCKFDRTGDAAFSALILEDRFERLFRRDSHPRSPSRSLSSLPSPDASAGATSTSNSVRANTYLWRSARPAQRQIGIGQYFQAKRGIPVRPVLHGAFRRELRRRITAGQDTNHPSSPQISGHRSKYLPSRVHNRPLRLIVADLTPPTRPYASASPGTDAADRFLQLASPPEDFGAFHLLSGV